MEAGTCPRVASNLGLGPVRNFSKSGLETGTQPSPPLRLRLATGHSESPHYARDLWQCPRPAQCQQRLINRTEHCKTHLSVGSTDSAGAQPVDLHALSLTLSFMWGSLVLGRGIAPETAIAATVLLGAIHQLLLGERRVLTSGNLPRALQSTSRGEGISKNRSAPDP